MLTNLLVINLRQKQIPQTMEMPFRILIAMAKAFVRQWTAIGC